MLQSTVDLNGATSATNTSFGQVLYVLCFFIVTRVHVLCTDSAWIAPNVEYLLLKKQRELGYDGYEESLEPVRTQSINRHCQK